MAQCGSSTFRKSGLPSRTLLSMAISAALLIPSIRAANGQAAAAQTDPVAFADGASFTDITPLSGVQFQYAASHTSRKYLIETMGSGVALFDFDNDGRLDIFAVNAAPLSDPTPKGTIPEKKGPADWNRLYHQRKDGTFEDVTRTAGLEGFGYGMGVAIGDYDNDGFEDLFVTAYGGNRLYHNNGNGTFSDVTAQANVAGSGWSTSAAWVDLDGDGLLDLVVLRYLQWDFDDIFCGEHSPGYRAYCHPDLFHPIAPLVYHNEGKGRFTEVGQKSGLAVPGKGLGIALADYDRDGRVDLFVANDSMPEFLYRNKGNGMFEEVALQAGVAVDMEGRTFAGMGVDFADYNNDGLPDLVVTDLARQRYAVYRNSGDSTFNYDSYDSGIGHLTMQHSGWGVRFFDYDNDGMKDLLIAQGHDLDTIQLNFPDLRYKEPMLLVRNTGKAFVDVSAQAGEVFQKAWVGRGLVIGDLDSDGRLDAVVSTNDSGLHILHNATQNQNHWLTLELVGHTSNRDAIGAEVKLVTRKGAQWATVSTASSYLSSSDKRIHFGMAGETIARSIEIRWPSGIRQTLNDVKADQIFEVQEPSPSKP